MTKTVIIIAGPTAVGKTSVAIDVAKRLNTEIISSDSRQCYKELKIGVARPAEEELQSVPHHFIATHSIHNKITAADFEAYALDKAEELFSKNNVVVMTGGTGLYIKAFCEGMDTIPPVPELVHNGIINEYKQKGLTWLQQEVERLDPLFYSTSEIKNPQRLMRALEVFKTTGQSVTGFRKGKKAGRNFSIVKIALEIPKEDLHSNINKRVDAMMKMGLVEEVRSLIPYQHLNALQTVGYRELFEYFNGMHSLEDAVSLIKQNTRQYAKRQLTWFRKDKEFHWLPSNSDVVFEWLHSHYKDISRG